MNRSDFYNLIGHPNDYAVVVRRIGTQTVSKARPDRCFETCTAVRLTHESAR
jgi:hypothetical protein